MNAQDSTVRLKAFRARLDPKPAALDRIRQIAGCRRYVYNRLLAERQAAWKALGESPDSEVRKAFGREWSFYGMSRCITPWRSELAWLRDCPVHALQNAARDLQRAYECWWGGRAGAPRPKKKSRGQDSWTESDPACFGVNGQAVRLPKIGWVRARISQSLQGVVRRLTIRQDGEEWWVSLLVAETLAEVPRANGQPAVGLDLGVVHAVTDSEGKVSDLAPRTDRERRQLRRLARELSRKKKGSQNREKAKRRLGRVRRKIDGRIRHELHVFTCRTAKNHGLVAVEDLGVNAMSASAAGSRENPGTRAAAKRGLNREIRERRWGEIRRQLEYKCGWYGSRLVAVPAAGTSQECVVCGHRAKENRKTQAVFKCLACRHEDNADSNAAKIILKRALELAAGHAASAWGENISPREGRRFSRNQEPPQATPPCVA